MGTRNLLQYQRALYLRKKKGYTYHQIQEELPVAKSTLSGWLGEIELTKEQKHRIKQNQYELIKRSHNLGEWNRKKRQGEVTQIRVAAKKEMRQLTDHQLFVAGIMLYWAEGNKSTRDVGISNADPAFVRFIMYWFRTSLGLSENRFRAAVHYHQGQSEEELKHYWSRIAQIPLPQFRKGFCKPPGTGHRKHYLQHGTLRIRVLKSSDLFHRISGWRDGLIQDIISGTH